MIEAKYNKALTTILRLMDQSYGMEIEIEALKAKVAELEDALAQKAAETETIEIDPDSI